MTVFAVLGQTLSGKDTLVRKLVETTSVKRIVTTTDRPIRKNEKNGIDYNFVAIGELDKPDYFGVRKFYTTYRDDPYCYGMNEEDFNTDKDSLVILDPLGVKALKEKIGSENVITVYLNVRENTLKKRALRRGDSLKEVCRRLKDDEELFRNADIYCDVVLNEDEDMVSIMRNIIEKKVGY